MFFALVLCSSCAFLSLCDLSALGVSVVSFCTVPYHGDTKDTEAAQRNPKT